MNLIEQYGIVVMKVLRSCDKAFVSQYFVKSMLQAGFSLLQAMNEAGGSLILAVLNGQVAFPQSDHFPEDVHKLVTYCLTTNPAERPFVDDVIARVQDLLVRCPIEC